MRRSILVPLDGSPLAAGALPHAGRLAQALRARVVLFHAREHPSSDAAPDLRASAALLGTAGTTAEARETPIRGPGAAGHAIVEMASSLDEGLIVMATHARGGLGRLLLGGIADQVVRRAPVPVLLIPDGCRTAWPDGRPLSILLPLDGSHRAEHTIGPASALAEALQTTLHLLRVVRVPDRSMYNYSLVFLNFDPEAELAEARAYLEGVADRLRARGLTVRTHTLTGTPGCAVADVARDLDIDVIAMATHGRGGLDRQVMGSIATDTIRRARRPIMIVGPSAVGRPGFGAHSEAEPAAIGQGLAAGWQDEVHPHPVGAVMVGRRTAASSSGGGIRYPDRVDSTPGDRRDGA